MRVVSWREAVEEQALGVVPSAATIGVFDGLHTGHQALIEALKSKSVDKRTIAVTFSGNPKRFKDSAYPGDLFTLAQKLEAFEGYGIDACILIDFSENFSKMSGEDFMRSLVQSCGVRSFIVGWDFTCGYRLSTKAVDLKRISASYDADVDIVAPVLLDGVVVSSSKIRAAILEGRTDRALAMLGYPYTLDVRACHVESSSGIRYVKLDGSLFVIPVDGLYSAELREGGKVYKTSVLIRDTSIVQWDASNGAKPEFIVFGSKL